MAKTIQIIRQNNTLTYQETGNYPRPHSIHVSPGEQIKWRCDSGDFGIRFAESPFDSGEKGLSAAQGNSTGFQRARPLTQEEKQTYNGQKPFKYFVAVHRQGASSPIVSEDPDVIIDDSGGQGEDNGKKSTQAKSTKKTSAEKKRSAKKKR